MAAAVDICFSAQSIMPHKCIGKSEVVSSLFCLCYVSVVSMFHCFCLPNSKPINKRKLIPCNETSLHNVRYSITNAILISGIL